VFCSDLVEDRQSCLSSVAREDRQDCLSSTKPSVDAAFRGCSRGMTSVVALILWRTDNPVCPRWQGRTDKIVCPPRSRSSLSPVIPSVTRDLGGRRRATPGPLEASHAGVTWPVRPSSGGRVASPHRRRRRGG